MDRTTGKVEVTAHNHGFAVAWPEGTGLDEPVSTPYGEARVSHVCLNDDVVEGIELRDEDGTLKSFSVQYHPEAAAGPHDAAYLFDRFTDLMRGRASDGTLTDGRSAGGGPTVDGSGSEATKERSRLGGPPPGRSPANTSGDED